MGVVSLVEGVVMDLCFKTWLGHALKRNLVWVLCSVVKATLASVDFKLYIRRACLVPTKGDSRCPCAELFDTGGVSVD
jgi:hypothetical protein